MTDIGTRHDCEWCDERLEPWLDGDLPEAEAAALEHHVEDCPRCRRETALARRVQSGLRSMEQPACPATVTRGLEERVARKRHPLFPALAAGLLAGALGLGVVWQMQRVAGPAQPSATELAQARAELEVALGYISAAGRAAGRDVGNVLAADGVMKPLRSGLDLKVTIPVRQRGYHETVESET